MNAKKAYGDGVYIAKRGKYEAIRIGMFPTYNSAKDYMNINKNIPKTSVIIDGCTNDKNLTTIGINNKSNTQSVIEPTIQEKTKLTYEETIF